MTSKAAQILDAVESVLAGIRTANGYLTDLGARVLRAREARSAEITPPALVLRPREEQTLAAHPGKAQVQMALSIEAVLSAGDAWDAALADAAHDVRRALMLEEAGTPPLGGLAQSVQVESVEYGEPLEGSDLVVADVSATVTYVDSLED